MQEIEFDVSEDMKSEASRRIHEGLVAFNNSKVGKSSQKEFIVSAKNSNKELIGGVKGIINRHWLFVHEMWVSERWRTAGIGSKLLIIAEDTAMKNGCVGSYLNTHSFQALEFYKKNGYEVFGELQDFPKGHIKYFLKKSIAPIPLQS
jgi:GNAT superfamily N-acetyltransferase